MACLVGDAVDISIVSLPARKTKTAVIVKSLQVISNKAALYTPLLTLTFGMSVYNMDSCKIYNVMEKSICCIALDREGFTVVQTISQ